MRTFAGMHVARLPALLFVGVFAACNLGSPSPESAEEVGEEVGEFVEKITPASARAGEVDVLPALTTPEETLAAAAEAGGDAVKGLAKAMKAEGVKAGVPDLDLPVPRGPFIGLRIELKAKGGKESPPQKWWRERLTAHGHRALVCVGWEEAKRAIETYLALPRMPVGWTEPA